MVLLTIHFMKDFLNYQCILQLYEKVWQKLVIFIRIHLFILEMEWVLQI